MAITPNTAGTHSGPNVTNRGRLEAPYTTRKGWECFPASYTDDPDLIDDGCDRCESDVEVVCFPPVGSNRDIRTLCVECFLGALS